MPEEKKETRHQRPERHIAAGILSASIGCGCALVLLVLLAAGSVSAAAALDPVMMSIQPFLIALSGVFLVGMVLLNLKLQKCCSLRGFLAQKKLVIATVAIYVIVLLLVIFVIEPYLMATVDRFMPMSIWFLRL